MRCLGAPHRRRLTRRRLPRGLLPGVEGPTGFQPLRPILPGLALALLLSCGGEPGSAGASDGTPGGAALPEAGPAAPRLDSLRDAAGRTHRLAAPPARILSLVPSASAVLLSLGAGERLVGRTDFDTARAMAHLSSVGGGLQPDLERILSLRPDIVLRFEGPSDQGTAESLDRLGVPHFAVRPDGIDDVREMIRTLGTLTGRERPADSLLASVDAALAEVSRAVAGLPPVRTAYVLGGTPPWVAGAGTFIDELITLAGGVNVFSDLGDLYAPVSVEELVRREVDVYLTIEGSGLDRDVLREAPVRSLGPSVELPGPHLAEAAREVARALHPAAFP